MSATAGPVQVENRRTINVESLQFSPRLFFLIFGFSGQTELTLKESASE